MDERVLTPERIVVLGDEPRHLGISKHVLQACRPVPFDSAIRPVQEAIDYLLTGAAPGQPAIEAS